MPERIPTRTVQVHVLACFLGCGGGLMHAQPMERSRPRDRAGLLAAAASETRPNKRPLEIGEPDGPSLRLGGQVQFRYSLNHRNPPKQGSFDETTQGFAMRRVRLRFAGTLPEHRLEGVVQSQFSSSTGQLVLFDAYVKHECPGGWGIRAGQFTLAFDPEVAMSNQRRIGTEQSLVGQAVGAAPGSGRVQGVELSRTSDRWRWWATLSDGIRSANTSSLPASGGQSDADIALTYRVEHLAWGDSFVPFRDMYALPEAESGLLLGAAVNFEHREVDADGDSAFDDDLLDVRWIADGAYEHRGFNAYGAVYGMHQSIEGMDDEERFGVVIQGGRFVTETTHLFARYEWATDDDDASDLSALTLGLNEFLLGTVLRLTTEAVWFAEPVTDTFDNPVRDALIDASDERNQVVIRAQLQLVF